MTSLYILAKEYQALENKLADMELDEQTIKDTLEGYSGELEAKAVNVAMFIRNLESSAEQIKIAENQMSERRKLIERKSESIKKYLLENMQKTGITKIDCPYFSIALKKNPPSVLIENESIISDDYIVTKTVKSIDKTAIKEALKNGKTVNGATLVHGERVEIK